MDALALIILGNLRAHFANALLNRAAAQQDFQMLLPVTMHWESTSAIGSGYSSAGDGKAQGTEERFLIAGKRKAATVRYRIGRLSTQMLGYCFDGPPWQP